MLSLTQPDFVNRQVEIQWFKELINQARQRTSLPFNGVSLHGVTGIGKSTLLTYLRDQIRADGLPCAYIDFSGGRYTSTTVATIGVLEDITNQLAIGSKVARNPSRFERAVRRFKDAHRRFGSDNITSLTDATISEFIHYLHQFFDQNPIVLILDTVEEARNTLVWLEKHVISKLILHPTFLILIAGRQQVKWQQFHVRARIDQRPLLPFTVETTKEQLPGLAHLSHAILHITGGHPLANLLVAQKLFELEQAKGKPLNEADVRNHQKTLSQYLVNVFIHQHILPDVEDDLLTAFRAVAIVRRFEMSLLTRLLLVWEIDKDIIQMELPQKFISRMRATGLVDWSSARQGYILDATIRRQLEMDSYFNYKQQYMTVHETAVRYYERLLQGLPPNYIFNLLELLYHQAKILKLSGANETTIINALSNLLVTYLKQLSEDQTDSDLKLSLITALREEIVRDTELFDVCGPYFQSLASTVEGFLYGLAITPVHPNVHASDRVTLPEVSPGKLRQILTDHFNESELRDLCFDLRINYDSLPGASPSDKARELVAYFERRMNLPQLIRICYRLRPNIDWLGNSN